MIDATQSGRRPGGTQPGAAPWVRDIAMSRGRLKACNSLSPNPTEGEIMKNLTQRVSTSILAHALIFYSRVPDEKDLTESEMFL